MKLFSSLYAHAMRWAVHRHAQWYLAGLSFAESSFFPIPPDVMLAPMALADNKKAWRYATMTTVASVAGGMLGYLIGYLAFDAIEPWVMDAGYGDKYQLAVDWFEQWGIWAILIAGFSPIPYKIFTIAAGAISMAFLPFVLASLAGRGARFFLVTALIVWGGERMEHTIKKYVDWLGWGLVIVIAVALAWHQFY
ncbi:MAG: DedA family protein [Gammaproteobacteria bacterium]|nr:DedA family protein [Gammaproteobacteria bacterium]MCF6260837.1 DedA family protein [Gammaproteobacteria bacterium]